MTSRGRALDQRGPLAVERPSSRLTRADASFEHAEGADDGGRHRLVADGEVVQAPLGLRAPVVVGRDVDRSHGVGFDPRVRHAHLFFAAAVFFAVFFAVSLRRLLGDLLLRPASSLAPSRPSSPPSSPASSLAPSRPSSTPSSPAPSKSSGPPSWRPSWRPSWPPSLRPSWQPSSPPSSTAAGAGSQPTRRRGRRRARRRAGPPRRRSPGGRRRRRGPRAAAAARGPGVADQRGEAGLADRALADVGVSVPVAAELDLGVVEVQAAQPGEPDAPVDAGEHGLGAGDRRVVRRRWPRGAGCRRRHRGARRRRRRR